jgi:tetratricopeptide (TPR) repeat protein
MEGTSRLQDLQARAQWLAQEGDYGLEALDVNTGIIVLDSQQASAYTRRGIGYLALGSLDLAEKDLQRAYKLDPEDETAIDWLEELPDIREARQNPVPLAWHTPDAEFGTHSVYVIELDRAVLEIRKFRTANPIRNPTLPCVYVGNTGLSPEKRFENHKAGSWGSRYVAKYGLRLLPHLYEHLNPMHREDAEFVEEELAEELRWRGYSVWSN